MAAVPCFYPPPTVHTTNIWKSFSGSRLHESFKYSPWTKSWFPISHKLWSLLTPTHQTKLLWAPRNTQPIHFTFQKLSACIQNSFHAVSVHIWTGYSLQAQFWNSCLCSSNKINAKHATESRVIHCSPFKFREELQFIDHLCMYSPWAQEVYSLYLLIKQLSADPFHSCIHNFLASKPEPYAMGRNTMTHSHVLSLPEICWSAIFTIILSCCLITMFMMKKIMRYSWEDNLVLKFTNNHGIYQRVFKLVHENDQNILVHPPSHHPDRIQIQGAQHHSFCLQPHVPLW